MTLKRLLFVATLVLALSAGVARAQPSCETKGECPVSVPDGGTTMALLGGTLVGLELLRQRSRR